MNSFQFKIEDISNHFSKISVDKFVVIPNHLHLILVVLSDTVCCDADAIYGVPTSADSACNLTDKSKQLVPRAIQQFKASASSLRTTGMNNRLSPEFFFGCFGNINKANEWFSI